MSKISNISATQANLLAKLEKISMNRQNIMTTLLILILLATGYIWFYYFSSGPILEETVKTSAGASDFRVDIAQLRRIRNLKLDTTIFEDKFFKILQSSPQPPVSPTGLGETVGRTNPFTPF